MPATALVAVFQNSWWVGVISIWFTVWAIRYQGELDRELDSTAKLIRWLIAIPSLALVPMVNSDTLRMSVFIVGLLFLVWPNTAYHLTKLLRFLRVLPETKPGEIDHNDVV
jgi:hypothetical protein